MFGLVLRCLYVVVFSVGQMCGALADSLSIGTWNLDGAAGLKSREPSIAAFGKYMGDVDFLVVQEALGSAQLETLLEMSGLSTWSRAISDFADDGRPNPYHKLEVAVLSPHAISAVQEADPYPSDDSAAAKDKDHDVSIPSYLPVDQRKNRGTRGWLWVEFKAKKTVVAAVHLKSSGGMSGRKDEKNSFKREAMAAALAETIKAHSETHNDWSYIVAGDFNVAPGDTAKVGTDLAYRCAHENCEGYDQTHALFGGGLVRGVVMRNLVEGLGASYAHGEFVQSPIDNIYAMGPLFDKTKRLVAELSETYGSDHYAIKVEVSSK